MEEQSLVVVKDNFLVRITKTIKRFFYRGKIKKLVTNEEFINNQISYINVNQNVEFIQEEILNARKAFRKYVINNNENISEDIFLYFLEKVKENENKITQILHINNDGITFDNIIELIENEKNIIKEFKLKDNRTGCYKVPIGTIGVVCSNAKQAISNLLKAISTRNSIIILHENYNKYSTESLILLIMQETLKNFYIDDNIIQIIEKDKVDFSKLDKVIYKDNQDLFNTQVNKCRKLIYIYEEDKQYKEEIIKEVDKIKSINKFNDFEVKVIKGEFGKIISFLNNNKAFAVCMYTKNSQKAYKLLNWIDSPNIYINTGINSCKEFIPSNDSFFNYKFVLHSDVF